MTDISNNLFGNRVRDQFPLLSRKRADGSTFTYLDSAATALKPECVIKAVTKVLSNYTANVHRSVYQIGDEATEIYEGSRKTVARFINADAHEVVFLRNTTEALNLVARCLKIKGRVVTSYGEHHSNLLIWNKENLTIIKPLHDGSLDTEALEQELQKKDVGLVALSHASNVTGTSIDAKKIAALAHSFGALFLLDGAQSVPHRKVDVKDIDCDFLTFSGHKLGSPTGAGVLYGKTELLAEMDWYLKGGQTVDQVHLDNIVAKQPPWKFEAGTPAIESVAGLGAAVRFLQGFNMEDIDSYIKHLTSYTVSQVREHLPNISLFGPTDDTRCGPVSLKLDSVSPHTIARGLSDGYGVCVRSGYHCAQPLHEVLGSQPTLRASFYIYNTTNDIDLFMRGVSELLTFHSNGTL